MGSEMCIRDRVSVARAALKEIAEASDPDSFHGAALRQRLKQIDELPDNVLYHDDLNPGARAFALHEVLSVAERNGLQFMAEASFPNLYGAAKGPAQQMLDRMPRRSGMSVRQSSVSRKARPISRSSVCSRKAGSSSGILSSICWAGPLAAP